MTVVVLPGEAIFASISSPSTALRNLHKID